MKNYKEITESLFKRRDEYVKQRKIKTKRIIVASTSFCLILIICVTVWQLDLFKTPPIDMSGDNDVVSSQEAESNDDTQNEVVSEPTESKSPIEQSAKDIPTEIGGAEGWWYDAVYEFKYNEESKSYIDLIVGKEPSDSWCNQFWLANKETYTRVEYVGIIGAIDEFGITKEQFVKVIQEQGLIVDGRYYFSPYYIGNTPIDDSFEAYERYWYLTQEEVDLIFLEDRELRDKKCRSRYTAFANGKIYTPQWICSHTAEDYIAAGLTKQQMIETISTWNNVGVPIVVEYDGEVWCDAERFKQVLEFVKIEIDKMP